MWPTRIGDRRSVTSALALGEDVLPRNGHASIRLGTDTGAVHNIAITKRKTHAIFVQGMRGRIDCSI